MKAGKGMETLLRRGCAADLKAQWPVSRENPDDRSLSPLLTTDEIDNLGVKQIIDSMHDTGKFAARH